MNKWQRFDTTVFTVSPKDFGKDIMQNTFELPDSGAVTLTVATYQTTQIRSKMHS